EARLQPFLDAADGYARTQRGSATSSMRWNTTRTGSPIVIVVGSTSPIGPSALATRLPTKRIDGAASSSTLTALYGASAANAGSSGGWATMNDQMRPRPVVFSHRTAVERHAGHIGRGGMRRAPQASHVCTRSSPRAHPAQNSFVVGSSTSGKT